MSHASDDPRGAGSRGTSRRRFLQLALGSSGLVLLAACQRNETPTSATTSATPSAKTAATTAPATAVPKSAPPAAAAATPVAAAATPTADRPVRGGTLTIGSRGEVEGLDPHKIAGGGVRVPAQAIYSLPTRVDVRGNLRGDLLEGWESSDAQNYVLRLRKGIKFQDGSELNAEGLKFNFERVKDPATGGIFASEMQGIESIEVVDVSTARVRLKEADAAFPARLADAGGWIVSPTAVKTWGDAFATAHPVGSGPFEFVEWMKDDHLTVKRFEGYWEKDESGQVLPYLDRIIFKPMTDLTVALAGVRAGNLDIIERILPSDLAKVKADPNLTYVEGPGTREVLWFNNSKPPFNNKALRQAVSWAIDRQAIHEAIFFNTGSIGQYVLPPESWAFDSSGKFYDRDPGQVKQKLTEAGQPNGFKFTTLCNNVTTDLLLAQAIKGQLAEVGIETEIVPIETNVNATRRGNGDYEASLSGLSTAVDPDLAMYKYLRTGQGINRSRYSNPKVDELLDKARGVTDQQARKEFYHQAQALILEDAPLAYLHMDADIKVMNKRVQGYLPSGDTYIQGLGRLWLKP